MSTIFPCLDADLARARAPRRRTTEPRRSLRRWSVAWTLLLVAARILAQATGTTAGDLRGRVHDESGVALPGVAVHAVDPSTGLARSAPTGAEGEFAIRLLAPGHYDISAALEGLVTARVERVVVVAGSSVFLDLTMRVAPVAESVVVDARASRIDFASTDVVAEIDGTEIRNLPINRRNFLEFALTTPGVTPDRGPQNGPATTSGFSVNGQSPRANNVMLDGLDDNDGVVGAVRSAVTQEAVREYQVIRAPFAAEYGWVGGGVVNAVTRSGANDLRGTAFLFFRNEDLSASNALAGTKTPYEQFQYGASLSGPVVSDRLFFFAAGERLDVMDANLVTIREDAVGLIRAAGFQVENGVIPFLRDHTSVLAKLDASPIPSQAWALRGSWASESDENQQPWGGLVARSAGGVRDVEDWSLGLTGTSLFGSGVSNEMRALYADRTQDLRSLDATGGPAVEIVGEATLGTQQLLPQPRKSRIYQLFDAVSFFGPWGTVKAGFNFLRTDLDASLPLYFHGYYQFAGVSGLSPLEAFALEQPLVFAQGFGNPHGDVSADLVSAFAQGEWTLGAQLLVRAGLRYDYEKPADPFPTDTNNWAPRLSFSWAPSQTWRVRGGLGRFYAAAPIGPMLAVGMFEDSSQAQIRVQTLLDDPSSVEMWAHPDRRYANVAEAGGLPAVFEAGQFESAFTDLASLGVDYELGRGWAASIDYVHARGQAILIERNTNPIIEAPLTRPNADFADIRRYESSGNSWYDGITLSATTGYAGPVRFSASWTFADAEDDFIDFAVGQPQDPLDPEGDLGPTIHVPKHRGTLAIVYAGPTAGPWWSRDWIFSAISDVSIGRPYNVLAGFDRNGNGDGASDRPEGVSRNSETLPPYWNVDLRVGRRIPAGPLDLEATLEVFNLFDRENVLEVNAVQYQNPELEENSEFGETTRVADPRRLQVGLRLSF